MGGTDVLITNLLSQIMNFTIFKTPTNEHLFGKFSCNKDKATGFLYKLFQNQIEIISVRVLSSKTACQEEVSDYLDFGIAYIVAIVPIFRKQAVSIWIGHTFLSTTGTLILLLVMIHLLSQILKFDYQYWDCTKLLEVILGYLVPDLPRELKERTIF